MVKLVMLDAPPWGTCGRRWRSCSDRSPWEHEDRYDNKPE
jgi:hypothetical protein